MILAAVVAMSEDNAIGKGNGLPWRLPDDLKFFKKTTLNKPVLMGRKTYESLNGPLKNRLNIVISGQEQLELPEGVLHIRDLDEGIERLYKEGTDEGFIIGGGKIFELTLGKLERIYLTRVHTNMSDADVFFPVIDKNNWKLEWEEHHPADEKHLFDFTFQRWDRVK